MLGKVRLFLTDLDLTEEFTVIVSYQAIQLTLPS